MDTTLSQPRQPEVTLRHKLLNRRIDMALLPFLSLLYLFNGLDRGNVGNAETQGFSKDIGASVDDLNLAVSLFYVTFVTLQPFSAGAARLVGPIHWMSFIMFCWGLMTIAQAFVRGISGLIVIRLLIGAFEAGFYPTVIAYLSIWYAPYDLAARVALFYSMYAIAGAFSGAIAYGVFHIKSHLHNWQWLFIIEGAATCVLALLAALWLPSGPQTAWFLDAELKVLASSRMQLDGRIVAPSSSASSRKPEKGVERRDVVETLKDWKLWAVLPFNILASVPGQAFSVFLPLVVKGLGYSSLNANLMSVPPYILGGIGAYLLACSSDARKERGYHILAALGIGLIGLIITVEASSHVVKYVGLCIVLLGTYAPASITVVWLSNNTPEPGKRALVIGVNGFGNLSGVIGAQLYKERYLSSQYRLPFYVTLAFVAVAAIGYASYRFALSTVNRKRIWMLREMSPDAAAAEDESRYADKKLTFIYAL